MFRLDKLLTLAVVKATIASGPLAAAAAALSLLAALGFFAIPAQALSTSF